jgi:manganese transport protein
VSVILGAMLVLTSIDPIKVTEYSLVLSALALPLTYFPILVVANDPVYMGKHVNGRLANGLGTVFLVVIGIAAVAAIPLMLITAAGQ